MLATRTGPFHLAAQTVTGAMQRICAEYDEMPGLRLTAAQAARLLALDVATCDDVLKALEESGYLKRTHGGFYVRAY